MPKRKVKKGQAPYPRRSEYAASPEKERALLEEYKKTGSEEGLTSSEENALKLRYADAKIDEERLLRDVGKMMGLSTARVQQLEKSAIQKLQAIAGEFPGLTLETI